MTAELLEGMTKHTEKEEEEKKCKQENNNNNITEGMTAIQDNARQYKTTQRQAGDIRAGDARRRSHQYISPRKHTSPLLQLLLHINIPRKVSRARSPFKLMVQSGHSQNGLRRVHVSLTLLSNITSPNPEVSGPYAGRFRGHITSPV